MTASIATGPFASGRRSIGASPAERLSQRSDGVLERLLGFIGPRWVGVGFAIVATIVYVWSNPTRWGFYDHFVWQAQAWLDGSAAIRYPVDTGVRANDYYQDVLDLGDRLLTGRLGLPWDPGHALIPFPPLPAVLLLPFVAVWGLATQGALVFAVLGGINVGLCWRMLTRVTARRDAAFLGTLTYGFGTVAWYAAMLGTTWFQAHVAASTFLFLAITEALDAERREAEDGSGRALPGQLALRGVGAGLLFGIACLARLTVFFGAPFFAFVGPGRTWLRRAAAAAIGCAVPIVLLLAYNFVTTGHVFHPAYDHIREVEYKPLPELYHDDWGTEDPRYIPVNAPILLLRGPINATEDGTPCEPTTGLLDQLLDTGAPCPLRPDPVGMSILLTTPAYLLAIAAVLLGWRRRLVVGAAVAVLLVALADLAHFSQGWVQFGYRFSNDFAPFAMVLVAVGLTEARRSRLGWLLAWVLVLVSVAINAWGVMWGVELRW